MSNLEDITWDALETYEDEIKSWTILQTGDDFVIHDMNRKQPLEDMLSAQVMDTVAFRREYFKDKQIAMKRIRWLALQRVLKEHGNVE